MGDGQSADDEHTLALSEQNDTVDLLGAKVRASRGHTARVAGADAPSPVLPTIGRYRLLELVGTGGMGMVWGAWDPELERRVALKLVRHTTASARARMLREGQVLARLSHPNVVPIFDVGELGEQVYLVMEWIRGTTLGAFAKQQPSRRDLLDAYRQAGAGLAAAHEAGVVHRDFKPDNAIRGDDGRVRVLDFGIAHDVATNSAPTAAGTPRYMAPEQLRGEPVTPACDQYAFCVSLRDATEALPAWVDAIIARGTEADPAKRFESMPVLLAALDRDPARRRRRAAVGIAILGAAVGAFAVGRNVTSTASAVEPCSGAADEVAASWNPAVRDRMTAHLRTLGPLGDGDAIGRELDGYATAWVDAHARACRSYERKELTQSLYEARLGCFARTRSQLAATTELLTTVSAPEVPQALVAARSLPDVRGCADIATAVVPPPAHVAAQLPMIVPRVERALVLATARNAGARAEAEAATGLARATGYEPLIARALLVEGRAITVEHERDARATFAEAMVHALRASDDVVAVEAYARWIFEVARFDPGAPIDSWPPMAAVAERLGNAGRFARALMYNNRAVAFLEANNNRDARTLLEQALEIAGDRTDLELLAIRQNLLQLETDPAAYERGVRALHDRLAAALGPDHPDVLVHRVPLALLMRDRANARAAMEAACRGFERWKQVDIARLCTFEAAVLADDGGDRAAASALMDKVIALTPPTAGDLFAPIARAYLALARDTPDRMPAVAALEQRLRIPLDSWWLRLAAADAWAVLGDWPRAYELLQQVDRPMYPRRIARARRMLATQWRRSRPAEARELARLALDWYRGQPGDEATVADLESIIAESR